MDTPLISIVTITYNAAACLEPTMQSVASQTCRDFEHIIIDGASSDSTLEIARRYPDTRILSERDNGLYDAMNKGIGMARGKYLLFLNAGDAFHSNDVLAAYADRRMTAPRHLSAPAALTVDSFKQGMLVCHQAFMVRKEIAPLYDLSYRFSADYDWTIRCMLNGDPRRFTNLSMIAIDYLSDGMTDRNKWKSLRERFRIMSKYYGFVPTALRHVGFFIRNFRR